MQLTLMAKTKQSLEKIEQDLQWYDSDKKKMLHFKGGNLQFEYKYDPEFKKYRSMPKVVNNYNSIYKRDYDSLSDWFEKNSSKFGLLKTEDRPGYSITIEVPDVLASDVEQDLYINEITYD